MALKFAAIAPRRPRLCGLRLIEPSRASRSRRTSLLDFSDLVRQNFRRNFWSWPEGGKLRHVGAFVIGILIGFLGGLFGKGGSAIATPLLSLIGFPGFIAVASPLPATIPGTLIASAEYWQSHLFEWEIVIWSAS